MISKAATRPILLVIILNLTGNLNAAIIKSKVTSDQGPSFLDEVFKQDNATFLERFLSANQLNASKPCLLKRRTLLMHAASQGSVNIAEMLIKKNAQLDEQDSHGLTPLMIAIVKNKTKMVHLLLENKADPNITAADGNTALLHTSFIAQIDDDIMPLLIAHKAKINIKDTQGNTPLINCIVNKKTQRAKILIQNNADVNIYNNKHQTALEMALKTSQLDVAAMLIESGANLQEKTENGRSLLRTFPYVIEVLKKNIRKKQAFKASFALLEVSFQQAPLPPDIGIMVAALLR